MSTDGWTRQQALAIRRRRRVVAVEAAAGSGKTRVLVARILHLLEEGQRTGEGLSLWQIAAITFTQKATEEMRTRLQAALAARAAAEPDNPFWRQQLEHAGWAAISTIHGFCRQILDLAGVAVGLPPGFAASTASPGPQDVVHRQLSAELEGTPQLAPRLLGVRLPWQVAQLTCQLLELGEVAGRTPGEMAVATLPRLERPEQPAGARALVEELFVLAGTVYERRLRERLRHGQLTAADLVRLARDALAVDWVRQRVARRWRHLLVDEFQDTDPVQAEILIHLAREPGGPEIFVVGDPQQSIYRFRGANLPSYRRFLAGAAGRRPIRLPHNFRTHPRLLRSVSELFARLKAGLPEVQFPYARPRPGRKDGGGEGRPLVLHLLPPEADPAAAAAELLAHHPWAPDRPPPAGWHRKDPPTCAVLCRTADQAQEVATALQARHIPTVILGGSGFFQRPEVVEVLLILQSLYHHTPHAVAAALTTPALGVPPAEAAPFARRLGGRPPWSGQALLAAASPRVRGACRVLDAVRQAAAEGPLAAIHTLWQRTGRRVALRLVPDLPALANLEKLASLARDWEMRHGRGQTYSFVRWLEAQVVHQTKEPLAELDDTGGRVVTVSTIHRAKGLEWDLVVVPYLERDLLAARDGAPAVIVDPAGGVAVQAGPLRTWDYGDFLARDQQECLAEEARVLYVALTRAREELHLLGREGRLPAHCWLRWVRQFLPEEEPGSPA